MTVAHLLNGEELPFACETDPNVDAVLLQVGVVEQALTLGEVVESAKHHGRALLIPFSASTFSIGGTWTTPL